MSIIVVCLLKVRVTQYPYMYGMSYGQKLWVLQIEVISTDATLNFLAIILGVRSALHTLALRLMQKPL